MKKLLLIIYLCLCFSVCGFCQSSRIVLSNGEWKPYISKDTAYGGFASHVVSRAFEISGLGVEYKWYGSLWNKAYEDAKNGIVSGSLLWSKNGKREEEMFFSRPVFQGRKYMFFYLKKKGFDWKDFNDLNGKIIGGTIKSDYGKEFENALEKGSFKMVRLKNDYLNFKVLLMERVDLIIAEEKNGYKILSDNFSVQEKEKITHHSKPVKTTTYHLVLSRKIMENENLINKFDSGLSVLKQSGEYHKMHQAFINGYYSKLNNTAKSFN